MISHAAIAGLLIALYPTATLAQLVVPANPPTLEHYQWYYISAAEASNSVQPAFGAWATAVNDVAEGPAAMSLLLWTAENLAEIFVIETTVPEGKPGNFTRDIEGDRVTGATIEYSDDLEESIGTHSPAFVWKDDNEVSQSHHVAIQGVIAHEFGHVFGANHATGVTCPAGATSDTYPTMAPSGTCGSYEAFINNTDFSSLSAADLAFVSANYAGACFIYGKSAEPCERDDSRVTDVTFKNGRIGWASAYEVRTASFEVQVLVQGKTWLSLGTVHASGPGRYEVPVDSRLAVQAARIIEQEEDGRRALRAERRFLGSVQRLTTPRYTIETVGTAPPVPQATRKTPYTVTIFTVPSLVASVQTLVADYWEALWNASVVVLDAHTNGSSAAQIRAFIDDTIEANPISNNAYHLIGGSNDWELWNDNRSPDYYIEQSWITDRAARIAIGVPAAGAPGEDLIPTFYVPDIRPVADAMTVFRPYYATDLPYADVDNDGSPDVAVTRWPIADRGGPSTSAQLTAYVQKMVAYDARPSSTGPYRVGAFVGDHIGSIDHRQRIVESHERVMVSLPFGTSAAILRRSSDPYNYGDLWEDLWNYTTPELAVVQGTNSSPQNAEVFNRRVPPNDFDVTQLTSLTTPVVVAGLCGSAGWTLTESATEPHSSRIAIDLLEDATRGAVAWIGPSSGSWTDGNNAAVEKIVAQILANPQVPVAQSFLVAMQEAFDDFPFYTDTYSSYVMLGNPLSIVTHAATPTSSPVAGTRAMPLKIFPNPSNPTTTIEFHVGGGGAFEVGVYDARGKLVAQLHDGHLVAGVHYFKWGGTDASGLSVATGVYFVQVRSDTEATSAKIVLLK